MNTDMNANAVLPRSVPVGPDLAPQLIEFERPIRSFVIHNSRPKEHEVMFAGNLMTVPAVDRIRPDKTAYDADGDPIPGTYVISDIYTYVEQWGDHLMTFDAERAVRHILGIPKQPPRAPGQPPAPVQLTSAHAIRGLSLLPMNPPKSMWHEVAKAGEHRAFLAAVEDARYTVAAYQTADAKAKEAGKAPRPPGRDYDHAIRLLKEYERLVGREIETRVAPYREESDLRELEEEIELEAEMKAIVQRVVDKAAEKNEIDKTRLFAELMEDPKVRAFAQKQFRFRKKGHLDLGDRAENASTPTAETAGLDRGDTDEDTDKD